MKIWMVCVIIIITPAYSYVIIVDSSLIGKEHKARLCVVIVTSIIQAGKLIVVLSLPAQLEP